MTSDFMRNERLFLKHMLRFFLVRDSTGLTESSFEILMRFDEYSKDFTVDIVNALTILMTRSEIGVLPHPINSDYFKEQLAIIRNNFTLRSFLEFSTRFMRRGVQDFYNKEFTALSSVIDGLVDTLEEAKRANIISESFFTDLNNLAVEMVEEDRERRNKE